MRTIHLLLLACLLFVSSLKAQTVTNVYAVQEGDNINVFYTLDLPTASVSLYVSTDGGQTFGAPLQKVTGDVGTTISAGNKKIIWDVLSERENLLVDNVVFKVEVSGFFEMVYVEGSTFMMGCTLEQSDCVIDETPMHRVTLSSFYIGKYEVTQAQWKTVMGSTQSYFIGDDLPVENVSWNDVQYFIRKLNAQTGKRYRLPTEAEWEFAARGGNKSNGYKYSGSNIIADVAWYNANSSEKGRSHPDYGTHQVGTKLPNELGIYDMSGNVWEWCSDSYDSDYYSSSSQTNPKGPSSGSYHVLRGGGWDSSASGCRVSNRYADDSVYRHYENGFRLVLDQ